jgi:predicted alpha-1,6-mannanase (GH76 family)
MRYSLLLKKVTKKTNINLSELTEALAWRGFQKVMFNIPENRPGRIL